MSIERDIIRLASIESAMEKIGPHEKLQGEHDEITRKLVESRTLVMEEGQLTFEDEEKFKLYKSTFQDF